MMLSKYIESLQKFMDEHGDLPCYYARDDEGNGYQEVSWAGSLYYLPHWEDEHRPDGLYDEKDVEDAVRELEEDADSFSPVVIIN